MIAAHLPGQQNVTADTLSRVALDDHIRVNPAVIAEIEKGYS